MTPDHYRQNLALESVPDQHERSNSHSGAPTSFCRHELNVATNFTWPRTFHELYVATNFPRTLRGHELSTNLTCMATNFPRTLRGHELSTNFTWSRTFHELHVATNYKHTIRSRWEFTKRNSKILTAMHAYIFYFIGNNTLLASKCVQLLRNHRASIACARTVHCLSPESPPPTESGMSPENLLEDSNSWANRYSTAQKI